MTMRVFKHSLGGWLVLFFSLAALAQEVSTDPSLQFVKEDTEEFFFAAASRGDDAIRMMGDKIAVIAARYSRTPDELKALLRTEKTLWLGKNGHLFYADTPAPSASIPKSSTVAKAPQFPITQTFKLHSRQGSAKTIYLDFNGHTSSNSFWSNELGTNFTAPPYDLDGSPSSFSNDEHAAIQSAWQRMANDYASFDVDVTTEQPPEADLVWTGWDAKWGMRVVFTQNTMGLCGGNCGGVAVVNSFGYTNGGHLQPAWVFNKSTSGQAEGETGSHEVGHTANLSHDGVTGSEYYWGHGSGGQSWAPIMGASFTQAVTQWSNGSYPGATNTQDDTSLLYNRLVKVNDDFPKNFPAHGLSNIPWIAGTTSGSSFQVVQNGEFSHATDDDYFRFTTSGGLVTFNIGPNPKYADGYNINSVLKIYTTSVGLVASADTPDASPTSLSVNLGPGTYVLEVTSDGDTDPAPGFPIYGNLGFYQVTGSFATP